MTSLLRLGAVDLGASSGRVMVATIGPAELDLREVHRFPNSAVQLGEQLVWDIAAIYREVLLGLKTATAWGPLHGIGIDSWAVDYGLLDADGLLLGMPVSHRDKRTVGIPESVHELVSAEQMYAINGLQELPFNTMFQIAASRKTAAFRSAQTLLLIPDLIGYWLTGVMCAERTNASTTGLYDASNRRWSPDLADALNIPMTMLPPLKSPGEAVGLLRPEIATELGSAPEVPVIAVGSHDTASAVVAVPAIQPTNDERFAYISSGTWSLVGMELEEPVLTPAARHANFTNEAGVDGTIRFLKNVMGLWVLSETLREWTGDHATRPYPVELLMAAAEEPPLRTIIDINDPELLAPSTTADPMASRIQKLAAQAGEPQPDGRPATVRCILDSLALAYRQTIREAIDLTGLRIAVIHIVGGGSQNALLCQLTADACELPVLAGPTEAAALGNALVQARSLGADLPDLEAMRSLVTNTQQIAQFNPRRNTHWDVAERRLCTRGPLAGRS